MEGREDNRIVLAQEDKGESREGVHQEMGEDFHHKKDEVEVEQDSEGVRMSPERSTTDILNFHGSLAQRQKHQRGEVIEKLKRAIRSKPSWAEKVNDKEIVDKYKSEAVEQGMAPEVAEDALQQLQSEAAHILDGAHKRPRAISSASSSNPISSFSRTSLDELRSSVAALQPKICHMMKTDLEEKDQHVWHVDNVVPPQLQEMLTKGLDAIANLPDKDFHPESNNQVQDLIHPSLFPYIEELSWVFDEFPLPPKPYTSMWARQYEDSKYQWLPAQFRIKESGSVTISSYINNLERSTNEELYESIGLIFELFLPMFEIMVPDICDGENMVLRDGRELQVIVKAANYIVQPKGAVYEGAWHVEGMSHEKIVASGIYYYHTSPWLRDGGLEFRRPRNEETDYPHMHRSELDEDEAEKIYSLDLRENIPLGAVPTVEGRLLAFSNALQHKVSSLVNESSDQVGMRKILVFFLVDPSIEIVSSKHIPEQQWARQVPLLCAVMSDVANRVAGKRLPVEIVKDIVSRAKVGLTMNEAKFHRLELMRERKFKLDHDNEEWEREYSLCEH